MIGRLQKQIPVHWVTHSFSVSSLRCCNIDFCLYMVLASDVLRDIDWTGNDKMEKTFENNAIGADRTVFRQYISTETGVTRIFPGQQNHQKNEIKDARLYGMFNILARKWKLDPPQITIDLFDPRFRPWYTGAVTAPKDVLFLLDQ